MSLSVNSSKKKVFSLEMYFVFIDIENFNFLGRKYNNLLYPSSQVQLKLLIVVFASYCYKVRQAIRTIMHFFLTIYDTRMAININTRILLHLA